MTVRNYYFYQITPNGGKHITHAQACSNPERTKAYRELTKAFNSGLINGYGFAPASQKIIQL